MSWEDRNACCASGSAVALTVSASAMVLVIAWLRTCRRSGCWFKPAGRPCRAKQLSHVRSAAGCARIALQAAARHDGTCQRSAYRKRHTHTIRRDGISPKLMNTHQYHAPVSYHPTHITVRNSFPLLRGCEDLRDFGQFLSENHVIFWGTSQMK